MKLITRFELAALNKNELLGLMREAFNALARSKPDTTRNWFLPRRASQSNGTGHMRWKVSGMLDWSADLNNPMAHITEDTVTLSLGPEMSYLSRSMR